MSRGFEIKPSASTAPSAWKLGADGRRIDESEEQAERRAKAERQAAAIARAAENERAKETR